MNPRWVQTLEGFIVCIVHLSSGNGMNPSGVQNLLECIVWTVH